MRTARFISATAIAMTLGLSVLPSTASAAPLCPAGWTEAQCATLAVATNKALGPVPGGATAKNFAVTKDSTKFPCPDGSAGVEVAAGKINGYTVKRWQCPKIVVDIKK